MTSHSDMPPLSPGTSTAWQPGGSTSRIVASYDDDELDDQVLSHYYDLVMASRQSEQAELNREQRIEHLRSPHQPAATQPVSSSQQQHTPRFRLSRRPASEQLAANFPEAKNLATELSTLNDNTADDDNQCSICLDTIDGLSSLDECIHTFCLKCILEWSQVTNSCPACRTTFKSITHHILDHRGCVVRVDTIDVQERKQRMPDQDDIDERLAHVICEVCNTGQDEDLLLICENQDCQRNFHTYCLRPRLSVVPLGRWVCRDCSRARREQQRTTTTARRPQPHARVNSSSSTTARRRNQGHDRIDEESKYERSVDGYDTDDGFVVDDDTIIYATQHPSIARARRPTNRRAGRIRSSNGTANRQQHRRVRSAAADDEEYIGSDDDESAATASTASDYASDDFEQPTSRRAAHASNGPSRAGRRQRPVRSSSTSTSTRNARVSLGSINRHALRVKAGGALESSTNSSSSNTSRSRPAPSPAERWLQVTMSQVYGEINDSNTGHRASHARRIPRSSSTSVSDSRRAYSNSTFPTSTVARNNQHAVRPASFASTATSSHTHHPPASRQDVIDLHDDEDELPLTVLAQNSPRKARYDMDANVTQRQESSPQQQKKRRLKKAADLAAETSDRSLASSTPSTAHSTSHASVPHQPLRAALASSPDSDTHVSLLDRINARRAK